jgi:hypothetical protein
LIAPSVAFERDSDAVFFVGSAADAAEFSVG